MGPSGLWRLRSLPALAVLAVVVLSVSPPGAAGAKAAAPSPKQMAKRIKALQQRAAALVDQVSALRAKTAKLEAAAPESSFLGLAGGDLTGSYPSPQLRAGTIVGSDLADGVIVTRHVAPDTLSGSHFLDNTIGSAPIAEEAIGRAKFSTPLVGGPQLGEAFIESRSVSRALGQTPMTRVACPSGTRVIGGGVEVGPGPPAPADSMTVTKSVPAEDAPSTTWEVQIFVNDEIDGGFPERAIIVKAICLRGS